MSGGGERQLLPAPGGALRYPVRREGFLRHEGLAFVLDMAYLAKHVYGYPLTAKQGQYLDHLFHMYRSQIPKHEDYCEECFLRETE